MLRNNGYMVLEARNIEQVLSMAGSVNIHVAILCHSIPPLEREKLIEAIQCTYPHAALLALHLGWERVEEADESIGNLSGPQALLDSVESLTRKQPKRLTQTADELRRCG